MSGRLKPNNATPAGVTSPNLPSPVTATLDEVMGPLAPHPISDFFPADVKFGEDDGSADLHCCLRSRPVVLYEGMVLMGRVRLRAAFANGVPPRFEQYDGDEPVAYALSLAFDGPNYTKGQRAAMVAYLQDWSRAQTHGGIRSQIARLQLVTCRDRARRAGVSVRYQADADRVAKAATHLLLLVIAGTISLEKAVKILDAKESDEPRVKRDLHASCKAEIAALRERALALRRTDVTVAAPSASLPPVVDPTADSARLDLLVRSRDDEAAPGQNHQLVSSKASEVPPVAASKDEPNDLEPSTSRMARESECRKLIAALEDKLAGVTGGLDVSNRALIKARLEIETLKYLSAALARRVERRDCRIAVLEGAASAVLA